MTAVSTQPLPSHLSAEVVQNITVFIQPVNQPPSFSINSLLTGSPNPILEVVEDAWLSGNPYNMTSFIEDILRGPDLGTGPNGEDWGETAQEVTFEVIGGSPLFAELPTIDENGTISFSLEENMCGNATFEVLLRDDGGTSRGGQDTSETKSFDIKVACENDPPVFSLSCVEENLQVACDSSCVSGDISTCTVNVTVLQVCTPRIPCLIDVCCICVFVFVSHPLFALVHMSYWRMYPS